MDEGKREIELGGGERVRDLGNENKQAIIHPISPLLLSSP